MSRRANNFFDQAMWLLNIYCTVCFDFFGKPSSQPIKVFSQFWSVQQVWKRVFIAEIYNNWIYWTNLFLRSHVPRLRKWVGCWREFWSGTQRNVVRGQAELLNCHAPLGQRQRTYSHWKKKNTRTMNERLTRFLLLDFLTAIVISNLF